VKQISLTLWVYPIGFKAQQRATNAIHSIIFRILASLVQKYSTSCAPRRRAEPGRPQSPHADEGRGREASKGPPGFQMTLVISAEWSDLRDLNPRHLA
jgi:hypothetical protein